VPQPKRVGNEQMISERGTPMASDIQTDKLFTLADLCRAIAAQRVPHTLRDGCYQVSVRDARRLAAGREHDAAAVDGDAGSWLHHLAAAMPVVASRSEMSSPS
jgi:hypothetical protein